MKKLLLIMVSVLLVVSFAGCDLFMKADVVDEVTVESRGKGNSAVSKGNSTTEFTATVRVFQAAADTTQNGNSDQWKTRDEAFLTMDYFAYMAGLDAQTVQYLTWVNGWDNLYVESDWDYIDGASIQMENKTNFSMDLNAYGAYDLSGKNFSEITLIKNGVELMTIKANGDIEGMYPVTAGLSMKARTVGKSDYKVAGTLSGVLNWDYFFGDQMSAMGIFTLAGTYK